MQTDSGNGVDIGYFLVDKEALNPEIQSNVSFELDILPYLIVNKKLGAYVTDTQYYYITNMQTLKDFEIVVKEKNFLPLPQEYWK